MVCLDSNIIIDFLRNKEYAVNKIKELRNQNTILSTSSINTFELFRGFADINQEKTKMFLNLLSYIRILNFNFSASKKAAEIFENLKEKGESLDIADIMIAAIVIDNNETLLTNNLSHFKRIPNLILEK